MSGAIALTMTINGETVERLVEPRASLADFLRAEGWTGTHLGCEHGVCGACTIMLDGRTARGCLVLAVQCEGAEVETIEGATASGRVADLQAAFVERNALQCGFCTPGMLLASHELLDNQPDVTRKDIREHLSGNYCRCTGYQSIIDAVETVAKQRMAGR